MSGTRRYQVQTWQQDGQWSNEVGEANVFTSEAEAEEAITELRALGDGWREAEYRVREIAVPRLRLDLDTVDHDHDRGRWGLTSPFEREMW